MLHTSFEVVVSLKVIFYPNGFLEKKNYAKTRPGSDFSTMSYRKGERNAMCNISAFHKCAVHVTLFGHLRNDNPCLLY